MKPSVYIFRGAPATGKSTIIPKFCELLEKPIAGISQDAFRWNFHRVGRDIRDIKDEEHLFAFQNMAVIYEQYLKHGGYNIVIEGLFTWDDELSSQGNVKQLLELAKSYGVTAKSIVLRADKDELIKRNSERPFVVPDDEFEMLYNNTYKTIGDEELVVDSTDQSLEETLESLKKII